MSQNLTFQKTWLSVWLIGLALVSIGCRPRAPAGSGPTEATVEPLVARQHSPLSNTPAEVTTVFRRLPQSETGIDFQNLLRRENHRPYVENGAGVAIADYDSDGLPDIYLVSLDGPNRLFRQVSAFRFEDVTASAGLDHSEEWGNGAAFADVDDDGDLDLYVCNLGSANRLYLNQGNGHFVERASHAGLDYTGASKMASFCDYDRDGDLDLYLVTYQVFPMEGEAEVRLINGRPTVHPAYEDKYQIVEGQIVAGGELDILFRNNGDGTFQDVSRASGIGGHDLGLSATWWDYNNDGFPDLYVANDFKNPDYLYRNNGDGTFSNVIREKLLHTPWFSMGADFGDVNNDGWMDLLVADMSPRTHYKQKTMMGAMSDSSWFLKSGRPRQYMRNSLNLNTGTTHWMEAAYLAGLDSTDWTWSVGFADLDNDGLLDVFATNGTARNMNDSDWKVEFDRLGTLNKSLEQASRSLQLPPLAEKNLAFRNLGDLAFESVGAQWGLDLEGVSHGAAFSDLDQDGDLDIVVNNLNAPVAIYRNDTVQGNRLTVELRGTHSNHFGFGATVLISLDGSVQQRQLIPARGYCSSSEPICHFGLKDATTVDILEVRWPSGIIQSFENVDVNQHLRITEPDVPPPTARRVQGARTTLFSEVSRELGLNFRHREIPFDDFAREPLLPYQLSRLGGGIAWADVNQDGLEDCYLAGGRGQQGQLYLQSSDHRFAALKGPWGDGFGYEGMSPLFLDYDSDGDQDLFVVTGSNEVSAESDLMGNRLFRNDGRRFTDVSEDALPQLLNSGSCAAACDFDRDGDLDIFLGSRMVPGKYPLTPESFLMVNENGSFRVATSDVAGELASVGLVNAALWSDIDNDGWVDLLVALDWGPLRVFHNEQGKLVEWSERCGTSDALGWWHGIAGGDLDGDGDVDYVVTNQGLNTKYKTDPLRPHRLYYADFDENGTMDLIESEYENDVEVPVRGRSCSASSIPKIADDFPTYHQFAIAPLEDIYGRDKLRAAAFKSATEFQSVVMLNDGQGRLTLRPLPRLAQISPGYGVALADFDADGVLDLCIAQNFLGAQAETGFMDGGLSLLLRGKGDGEFDPVWPAESGIEIAADSNGLSVCDFDRDGWVDIAICVNDGPVRIYRNNGTQQRKGRAVKLAGLPGNPTGIGARVTVATKSGRRMVREVYGGSSYLSQSSPIPMFGLDERDELTSIEVRWPDGTQVRSVSDGSQPIVQIQTQK